MRIAILLLPLLLAGCLTTPIIEKFPEVPAELLVACPDLKQVDPATTKLSQIIGVVAENYGQYQECQIKVDTWIEWYNHQKVIFNSVK
jgi:hypothetical protein